MKRYVLLIIVTLVPYLYCSAQRYLDPSTKTEVVIPINTYRDLREKFYLCDTIIENKNTRIRLKDSIISTQDKKIESYQQELVQKDTTISRLSVQFNKLYNEKPKYKPFEHAPTWIALVTGLLLGFLIAK